MAFAKNTAKYRLQTVPFLALIYLLEQPALSHGPY